MKKRAVSLSRSALGTGSAPQWGVLRVPEGRFSCGWCAGTLRPGTRRGIHANSAMMRRELGGLVSGARSTALSCNVRKKNPEVRISNAPGKERIRADITSATQPPTPRPPPHQEPPQLAHYKDVLTHQALIHQALIPFVCDTHVRGARIKITASPCAPIRATPWHPLVHRKPHHIRAHRRVSHQIDGDRRPPVLFCNEKVYCCLCASNGGTARQQHHRTRKTLALWDCSLGLLAGIRRYSIPP